VEANFVRPKASIILFLLMRGGFFSQAQGVQDPGCVLPPLPTFFVVMSPRNESLGSARFFAFGFWPSFDFASTIVVAFLLSSFGGEIFFPFADAGSLEEARDPSRTQVFILFFCLR